MSHIKLSSQRGREGFTLTEVLIASAISLIIVGGSIGFFVSTFSYWHGVNLRMDADRDVNLAISHMVYGMGDRLGLRAASGPSVRIVSGSGGAWTLNYNTGGANPQTNSFVYSAVNDTLVFNPGAVLVGRDIANAQVALQGMALDVTLRADKARGTLNASREISTTINFRNL